MEVAVKNFRRPAWLPRIAATVAMSALSFQSLRATARPASEEEIKVAFLYNFTKFVEWPTDTFKNTTDPIVLGYMEDDAYGETIERMMDGKSSQSRPIVLKKLKDSSQLAGCHVLFLSSSERRRLPDVLGAAANKPILSVSDIAGFAQKGGIIGLTMSENRVHFCVNTKTSDAAGLKLSAQVLKLADPLTPESTAN